MRKTLTVILAIIIIFCLTGCTITSGPKITVVTITPTAAVTPTEAPSVTPVPADSPSAPIPDPTPTQEPTPTAAPASPAFDETPDHAGSGDVLFDIYVSSASFDLNKDGTPEQIAFTAGTGNSTLTINGETYTVNHSGLAQKLAVTDVDKSDSIYELAFTDKYQDGLADTEFPYTYLYWWTGTALKEMGSLMDVKFDGSWRTSFKPKDNFDANGAVYCRAHSTELTDIWYMQQLKPSGADRKLKQQFYATNKLLATPAPLKIKTGKACLLLAHGDSSFFSGHSSMWDYASWPHSEGRAINPNADIIIIAQAGETLKIVGMMGDNWIKLQTSDNHKGWVKAIDGNIQGYYQVMHYSAADIFEGIVIAG